MTLLRIAEVCEEQLSEEEMIEELPLDIDLAKQALEDLWELVSADNEAIIGVSVEKDKLNPGGYVMSVKLTNNKIFHYAAYITSWGSVEVDGF